MKKTHTLENVLKSIKKIYGIKITNNTIVVYEGANIGIHTWGKLDYLSNNGYIIKKSKDKIKDENNANKILIEQEKEDKKSEKKNNVVISLPKFKL